MVSLEEVVVEMVSLDEVVVDRSHVAGAKGEHQESRKHEGMDLARQGDALLLKSLKTQIRLLTAGMILLSLAVLLSGASLVFIVRNGAPLPPAMPAPPSQPPQRPQSPSAPFVAIPALPALLPVGQSGRLLSSNSRLSNSSNGSEDEFQNVYDFDSLDDEDFQEFKVDKVSYAAFQSDFDAGFQIFRYFENVDAGGQHVFPVNIVGKDDISDEEGDIELAAGLSDDKVHMEVLLACNENATDICHAVIPTTGERRLRRLQDGHSLAVPRRRLLGGSAHIWVIEMSRRPSPLTRGLYHGERRMQSEPSPAVFVTNTAGRRRSGCFPAGTMLQSDGFTLPIQTAQIGMQLMTSQGLAPFFIQGHADSGAATTMLQINTFSNHSITATFDHYFPLVSGKEAQAQHLSLGDELWVSHHGTLVPSQIVEIRQVTARGLFNPYTTIGDLVVNGVLASSHSSWFLQDMGFSDSFTVAVYKSVFLPLSLLYYFKPSSFQCFHKELDEKDALSKVATSKIISTAISCLWQSGRGVESSSTDSD